MNGVRGNPDILVDDYLKDTSGEDWTYEGEDIEDDPGKVPN